MFIVFFVYSVILIIVGYFCFKKDSIINVYSIITLALGVVYILPYFDPECPFRHDQYFSIVISIGLLGFLLSFFLISFLRRRFFKKNNLSIEYYARRKSRTTVMAVLAFGGITLIWFSIIQETYAIANEGLVAFLLRDRVREYQEVALSYNYFINYLKNFLIIPSYFYMFLLWKRHNRLGWLFFMTLLFELVLFSHTRFVILSLLALPILYYHFMIRPIDTKKMVILIVFMVFLIGVFNVIRGGSAKEQEMAGFLKPVFLYEQLTRAGSGSTKTFYTIFQKIQKNKIDIECGKQYLLTLYTPIPRMFWPEKPIVSYFWRLTEIVEGQLPGIGQKVLTSTFLGEAYHQFGLIGVFLLPSLYMLIVYFYIFYISHYENTELIIWLEMISLPMDIRGGLSSVILSLVQSVIIFFILSGFIYKSSRRDSRYNPIKSIFPF